MDDPKKTVLIVEDNPDNRLLVRALLAQRYRFVECEDGASALATMRSDPPDLVLLDVSLPGMDGREVLQRIRSDHRLRDIAVIALTAHAMPGDRQQYLELGFDAYISKPITDAEEFRRTVAVHVRGS